MDSEQTRKAENDFINQLPSAIETIESIWKKLVPNEWDSQLSRDLCVLLHQLSASCGVLGYMQINQSARELEKYLSENIPYLVPGERHIAQLKSYYGALINAFGADKPAIINQKKHTFPTVPKVPRAERLLYLVGDDPIQTDQLALQIGYYGYRAKTFLQIADLHIALQELLPTAIIADVGFQEGDTIHPDAIIKDQQFAELSTPVIYISSSSQFSSRLQAVRAYGEAYLHKPVEMSKLIDTLDRLTTNQPEEKYRVLLVEDSRFQALYYSQILEAAGMTTMVLDSPIEIFDRIINFKPDIILLDMYMPDCSGIELAAVIRQMDAYISIPIVYLSAETDIEKQLHAMSLGGDDFLSKPIKPEHLIASLKSRIARHHKMRSFMVHDSLTGLLNHTTTNTYLEQQISRAGRQNSQLSFVMMDIDKFKLVNDTYGHPTGDSVLKSLSRLLKQRLRKSDIIGRYGGEEFAVIMPDTPGNIAYKIIDDMRTKFGRIYHQHEKQPFSVTFSGGIAYFPKYRTMSDLREAADQMLYKAKEAGRDRIVLDDTAV